MMYQKHNPTDGVTKESLTRRLGAPGLATAGGSRQKCSYGLAAMGMMTFNDGRPRVTISLAGSLLLADVLCVWNPGGVPKTLSLAGEGC